MNEKLQIKGAPSSTKKAPAPKKREGESLVELISLLKCTDAKPMGPIKY